MSNLIVEICKIESIEKHPNADRLSIIKVKDWHCIVGLDNREINIREASNEENIKNRKSKNSNNTSGYRNVSLIDGFYRIQIQIDGKNHRFSEKFDDVDKAGLFAKKMREKYYGEFSGEN